MRLNSEKNIMLCQKALYSKQLQYYSKLCSLYSELAKLKGPNTTPDEIQDTYSEALSLAAKGDLSFLDSDNKDNYSTTPIESTYSDYESKIFKKYAFYSERLSQFKEAATILKGSIIRFSFQEPEFDLTAIDKYEKYMQNTSRSTQAFDKFINESSPRLIGNHYYLATKQSIKNIDKIDSSHLNSQAFSSILTPVAFGATIKGVKTPTNIIDDASNIFEKDEKIQYAKNPNIVVESAYIFAQRSKNKMSNFYTANKTAVRLSFAAIATATALLGGVSYSKNINKYNNLTSQSTEYESYISNKTREELKSIRERLTSYQNMLSISQEPSIEDIKTLREDLDNVIDLVMSDLTTSAFETTNPDCKVTAVETKYDKTANRYTTATSEVKPEHFCTINYVDENGKQQKVVVTNFSAFSIFAKDAINISYEDEYTLDHSHPSKTTVSGNNFEDLLNTYSSVLENTEHLAATKMIYSNGIISPSLKTVIPEEKTNNSNETRNDNER